MDAETIRQRLAEKRGDEFWRCLEELVDAEGFEEYLHREFPRHASVWDPKLSRRKFLSLMAASLALAGATGCPVRPPPETLVPYVRAPEQIVPGKPLFFATSMTMGGVATGLLVESHEGRPTKVEGNELHPASLGATDAFAQASVLQLYDPDRAVVVTHLGQPSAWEKAERALRAQLQAQREKKGAGLRLLTEAITSPSLVHQIDLLLQEFPEAKWHQYEPVNRDSAFEAAKIAFGEPVDTQYRFDRALRVLSLDCDFLMFGPGHLHYAREFAARRRYQTGAAKEGGPEMLRMYAVEPVPTITGAKADHHWPLLASEVEQFARDVASRLGVDVERPEPGSYSAWHKWKDWETWIEALVRDLKEHGERSIVIPGEHQPAEVHILAHAMNHALGNVGQTVFYIQPVEPRPVNKLASLKELVADMAKGRVEVLVILGGNPAYTSPADLKFAQHMVAETDSGEPKVPFRVCLSIDANETSELCQWHIPESHYLESWGDARAFDGTISLVQPLIAPLYESKTASEVVSAMVDPPGKTGYQIVRDHWFSYWKEEIVPEGQIHLPPEAFEQFWSRIFHDGLILGTDFPPKMVSLQEGWQDWLQERIARKPRFESDAWEIVFRPDPSLYDGRFANNGWLQELPKPLTKLTWDNAALMSLESAISLDIPVENILKGGHGGHYQPVITQVLELSGRAGRVMAPAWVLPGHADRSITVYLGHGREFVGRVGKGVGFDAYRLRTSEHPYFVAAREVRLTSLTYRLACTQKHFLMEGREIVRHATAEEFHEHPEFAEKPHHYGKKESTKHPLSLYPEYEYDGYKWGMAIDLTACIGCNACIVACQAENNIPVVGKEQVAQGREMHWLRVDRYYRGDMDHPEVFFQPLPCMHCEKAPCEYVCPVEATVHSEEGLNDMIYNRCIGTRYCSNNCPYKVRRFNFFDYGDFFQPGEKSPLKMLANPEVTVRGRGVMEKCTYCVQRIRRAQSEAQTEDRPVRVGEIATACQAACPAHAITFGDMNAAESEVSLWKHTPLNYELLGELNTQPRTTYLAALTNPNPQIEKTKEKPLAIKKKEEKKHPGETIKPEPRK